MSDPRPEASLPCPPASPPPGLLRRLQPWVDLVYKLLAILLALLALKHGLL